MRMNHPYPMHQKAIVVILTVIILISCSGDNKTGNREFFIFEPDIRLFTAFAFMNAAGFDDDWNDTMHRLLE